MSKDYGNIATTIERRLLDGEYDLEDNEELGRGKRQKKPPNYFGLINDQSREQHYRDETKQKKRKGKKRKKEEPSGDDLDEDEEDEEYSAPVIRRSTSIRKNVIYDTDDDSFIDNDLSDEEPNTGINKSAPNEGMINNQMMTIRKGGIVFNLENELSHDSDDSDDSVHEIRQKLERRRADSQQEMNKRCYEQLKTLQDDDMFDDDSSDSGGGRDDCIKGVTTTTVNGNNNVVSVTHNHYSFQQPPSCDPYHQNHLPLYGSLYGSFGYYNQPSLYTGSVQVPAFLRGTATVGYNQNRLIHRPQTSFALLPPREAVDTAIETSPTEKIRRMIETYGVFVDSDWLRTYKRIFMAKLESHCLRENDKDWMKNMRRNRCGKLNSYQLEMLDGLHELR